MHEVKPNNIPLGDSTNLSVMQAPQS